MPNEESQNGSEPNPLTAASNFTAKSSGATPQAVILVADDLPDDIEALQVTLRNARILNPVQVVTNGEEAIRYLKGEGFYEDHARFPFPALLLLDLKMPGWSGFDVLIWLVKHPRFRPEEIVVLSGMNSLEDIRKAYQLGASSFLTKPVVMQDLLNVFSGFRKLRVESGLEGLTLILP